MGDATSVHNLTLNATGSIRTTSVTDMDLFDMLFTCDNNIGLAVVSNWTRLVLRSRRIRRRIYQGRSNHSGFPRSAPRLFPLLLCIVIFLFSSRFELFYISPFFLFPVCDVRVNAVNAAPSRSCMVDLTAEFASTTKVPLLQLFLPQG